MLAAEEGQLDASVSLFTVLAAINAAGYDADLGSAANHPLRAAVRRELAAKQLPILAELKAYCASRRQKDPAADLSQYVSFALSVEGPPSFKYKFRTLDLPPDVVPLEGFDRLMARFWKEAGVEELWRKSQPAFEEAIARYHEPVTRALIEVNGFLRNPTSGYLGRRFQIYIDLLGAPNQIHTRSYADDYFVVLTPSPEPQTADVRHAYLHYLLDPMVMRYADLLAKNKALGDFAQGSPILEDYYKADFSLLAVECMVRAVEIRLSPGPAERRQQAAQQAFREGYILTPHFFEQLPAYEKQEQSMRFYMPEIIKAIDLKREEQRLEKVEWATERPVRKARVVPAERKVELTGPYRTLEEAENLYAGRQYPKAKEAYLKLAQETTEKSLLAKSFYGLARIAALEKNPEMAEKLFQQALESSDDAQVKAWSLVYLGRLADLAGEREQASRHYQAVLAVEGAPPAARQAAEKGLKESFKKN